jgi:tRNA(Ile)-lysidine synthase
VRELVDRLLKTIRKQELIRPGDRVAAAVSGGGDSVALLSLLIELRAELGTVLSVAHVNHKLRREESDADERFVADLAQQHGLQLHLHVAPLDNIGVSCNPSSGEPSASGQRTGVEARARELRYGFFRQLARDGLVTKVATAHTLDDQAETLLLRTFRGTGIRGLSGIHPRLRLEGQGRLLGEVIRPLLGIRRAALQRLLRARGQTWREDSSNRDISFLRNRLRHRLLPIIAHDFGEAAIEHMAELAEIARAEEEHWQLGHPEVRPFCMSAPDKPASEPELRSASLPLSLMLALPLAAQRRLTREWLEMNAPGSKTSFRLTNETLEMALGPVGRRMKLPGGWVVQRASHELLLHRDAIQGASEAPDYEYALAIPGMVEVPELSTRIEARVLIGERIRDEEPDQLLNPQAMPKSILIRNWRVGDRYWPAHTSAAKKVKELLSALHATGTKKKLWPVAVAEGFGIIWMRGFAVPAAFQAPEGAAKAISIRECRA